MPRAPKIFTSKTPEPLPFTLDGDLVEYVQTPDGVEMKVIGRWEENFTAMGAAPPGIIVHLLQAVSVDTSGRASWQVPSLIAYVTEVLVEMEQPRWAELMSDETRLVDAGKLGDLVEWLNEELFGRPLVRAGVSASTH